MQHVPVPKIGVNEIFYLRQLWLYTFGIHQHSIEKPFFFFCWSETDSGHGVNDVLSCLLTLIKERVGPQVDTLYGTSLVTRVPDKTETVLSASLGE
ncbi:hypothetical protein ANN_17172 [Periplaneta americana]|uniref:Uncharacterized protein n=1 Tax=Periplaneta americana TaxID=6978 RepID=A0ABQ8SS69_PERAM|nr:hypothetical protein ANN_17172 [Periplaneta americana]